MDVRRFADRLPLLLLPLVLACFWYESWEPRPQFDDAYISYRYARNLAEGNGLVYNIGEWVEGYTNLLWTLLVAAGLALGGEATQIGHTLGLASGTAALITCYIYAVAGLGTSHRWIAAVAPFLLWAWIGFPIWTLSGLETPLFAAAVGGALAAEACGRIGLATAVAVVASLTRPEGALLAAVILSINLLRGPAQRRQVIASGAAYAVFLALLTSFRLYYYGSPVPNTFYAKTGTSAWWSGLGYLRAFISSGAVMLLVPAAWAVTRDRRCWVGATWCVVMGFYIVSVGGDAFPFHRFWVPVYLTLAALAVRALILQTETERSWGRQVPLWSFVLAAGAWSLVSVRIAMVILVGLPFVAAVGFMGKRVRRLALSSALVLAALLPLWFAAPWLSDVAFAKRTFLVARVIGRRVPESSRSGSRLKTMGLLVLGGEGKAGRSEMLEEVWEGRKFHLRVAESTAQRIKRRMARGEPIRLIAAGAIGKLGYDLRLPILDLLGLVDAEIARSPPYTPTITVGWVPGHTRTNSAYVFSRQPDYIILGKKWSKGFLLPMHDDLWSNPRLEADYAFDKLMRAYRRRGLLQPPPGGAGTVSN